LVSDRLNSWVIDCIIKKESSKASFDSEFKKIVVREEEREDKNQKSVKTLICVLAKVTCKEKNRFRIDALGIEIDAALYDMINL
jgi:hypothetical protein